MHGHALEAAPSQGFPGPVWTCRYWCLQYPHTAAGGPLFTVTMETGGNPRPASREFEVLGLRADWVFPDRETDWGMPESGVCGSGVPGRDPHSFKATWFPGSQRQLVLTSERTLPFSKSQPGNLTCLCLGFHLPKLEKLAGSHRRGRACAIPSLGRQPPASVAIPRPEVSPSRHFAASPPHSVWQVPHPLARERSTESRRPGWHCCSVVRPSICPLLSLPLRFPRLGDDGHPEQRCWK